MRLCWVALTASCTFWAAAEAIWSATEAAGYGLPTPSIADASLLCCYVATLAALLLCWGTSSALRLVRGLLDALLISAAAAALVWRFLVRPQLQGDWSWELAIYVAYPVMDLALLVVLTTVGLAGHRRAPIWLLGVVASVLISTFTDIAQNYLALHGGSFDPAWLKIGWTTTAILLCLSAAAARRADEAGVPKLVDCDLGLAPMLAGVGCVLVTVGVDGADGRLGRPSLALGALMVITLVIRLQLSVADGRRTTSALDAALAESQRLAVTDTLTKLHNRRHFETLLQLEHERCHGTPTRNYGVLIMDLDHFKHINDTHGHPSGDAVLTETAARLRRALRPTDVLARYGGEEFVALLYNVDDEQVADIAERCRLAVAGDDIILSTGASIRVTTSVGGAVAPANGIAPTELILQADRALYAAKAAGRNRVHLGPVPGSSSVHGAASCVVVDHVRAETLPLLLNLAELLDARLGEPGHSTTVARWAGALADVLNLDAAARERAVLAGRLHDIGKAQLPDALLSKPGPLSPTEWLHVQLHADAGADLLQALGGTDLPDGVPEVVKAHHERVDGTGYPRGLTRSEIPLEARIVAVCDAWAAMRTERPHARALSADEAREQLAAARNKQFDAQVVDTFLALEAQGELGDFDDPCPVDVRTSTRATC